MATLYIQGAISFKLDALERRAKNGCNVPGDHLMQCSGETLALLNCLGGKHTKQFASLYIPGAISLSLMYRCSRMENGCNLVVKFLHFFTGWVKK